MQTNLHISSGNQFTTYSSSMVAINQIEYTNNLLVTTKQIHPLDITSLGELDWEFLSMVIKNNNLDLIIFGTSNQTKPLDVSLQLKLQSNNTGYEIMSIPALCRTFNYLSAEDRNVAAIILF